MVAVCIDNILDVRNLAVLDIERNICCYLISFRCSVLNKSVRTVRKSVYECRCCSGDPSNGAGCASVKLSTITLFKDRLTESELCVSVIKLLSIEHKSCARKFCSVIITANSDLGDLNVCPSVVEHCNMRITELVLLYD